MLVHVLLYEVGKEGEGIHSIDIKGQTIVIMFEDKDDAERYKGLLEAQDFPTPSIELIEKEEIQMFCKNAGYESRLVERGFVPETEEDRLLISPPPRNLETTNINENQINQVTTDCNQSDKELDALRQKLEKLL